MPTPAFGSAIKFTDVTTEFGLSINPPSRSIGANFRFAGGTYTPASPAIPTGAGTTIKLSGDLGGRTKVAPLPSTTSLLKATSSSTIGIVFNQFNGYIYYVLGNALSNISVINTSGTQIANVISTKTISSFGGGLAVNNTTGVVYFLNKVGTQWGVGAIAPGTYTITYNNIASGPLNAPTGGVFSNGSIYYARNNQTIKIDTSTWAVTTYMTYTSGLTIQGLATVGTDIYTMIINNSVYKNTSTTGLVATSDFWGMTTDGTNLFIGGAGTRGCWRTLIGTWGACTNIITSGTYNPPQLYICLCYGNGVIYIGGYLDNAIIKLV